MENKQVQHIQVPHDLGSSKNEIKMNPTDYLIYGYMRQHMDKDTFQTFISLRTLAELAQVSINTVQNSIKKLNSTGEIKILEKKRGRSNVYEIQKTGKYFERFTYEFMDAQIITQEEKGVLLAMQQYTNTKDGQYAITTKSNKELADKMDISTRVLSRVFRQLEDKGIMITSKTSALDKMTGLRKTAKLVDLSLVCQAILFVNQKVDEHTTLIEEHDKEIRSLRKEILKLKHENETLINKFKLPEQPKSFSFD